MKDKDGTINTETKKTSNKNLLLGIVWLFVFHRKEFSIQSYKNTFPINPFLVWTILKFQLYTYMIKFVEAYVVFIWYTLHFLQLL
jgi:nucleoside permease NupC